ncbi:nucleoside triphosphate pyrophosphohydrolase [Prevotella aurantiaca JCM 15754]|uniref:Nucleoside triphosphate pyrophosphohydrolase n=1 Tax=Prevotella aurantiaca TaxID=596085 RepID=A0A930HNI8_9BACT|nr:nucleoside triphosphate pyrophosphohydrolase [Prevotella aurantiaca]MBF1384877.1 nucleoside triphosphate pyrophosphohydrolase [Prevotella aurantiaca]MBF1386018.1 nucleoside triphosphate pyrophosphohydrolase [Prevotella aurantiaca]
MHTKEEKIAAFERLLDIQERLRKECPWDRKQTFESLRPNTIEETFELADALMKHDKKNICKELGDVMEHVVFYALLGSETNDFDIADVCNAQSDKLMFRHDFIDWTGWIVDDDKMAINKQGQVVYKDELNTDSQAATSSNGNVPSTATQVESTWEQRKQKEREGNKMVLSGVPDSLPSLIKAYRIQDKARNVGFDWEKKEDVWEKVSEELKELKVELAREDKENSTKELGDFLFSVINAARLYKLNPDNALEHTNQKFISRFTYVEKQAKELGKELKDMTLEEMDKLWDEAKNIEKTSNIT